MSDQQRRFFQNIEFRAAADGADKGTLGTLTGYAAVFNSESLDLGGFREVIQPGCFERSLKRGDDITCLVQHDRSQIIGRRSAGTLKVEEDARGLRYEVNVPDTQAGRDVIASVKRGDINGSSFGFRTVQDKWSRDAAKGGTMTRSLVEADLFDVGPVTYPAYMGATVEARSLSEALLAEGRKALGIVDAAKPAALTPAQIEQRDLIIKQHRLATAIAQG